MVWCIQSDGYFGMVVFRNTQTPSKTQKPVTSLNSIAFIVLALFSLFVFFKLGKVRASNKQLNRNNRINRFGQSNKSNIYEGEAKEIHEDKKEDKDN